MKRYAHSLENRPEQEWQLLDAHLENTAGIAESFSSCFNAGALGRAAGVLHDLGKATRQFQQRLNGAPGWVDHSSAGGQEAVRRYGEGFGTMLAYAVMGHHCGLPNGGSEAGDGSLIKRLAHRLDEEPESNKKMDKLLPIGLRYPFHDKAAMSPFSVAFFVRMLYSALVDADSLDTEQFCSSEKSALRGTTAGMGALAARLGCWLTERFPKPPEPTAESRQAQILTLRAGILRRCTEAAALPRGIYTLTVPTGGGKTFASLSFALNHAAHHEGMRRVIYAIPFTSIIEQNARQFRMALGEENVLEHHNNADFGEEEDESNQLLKRMRLSSENWDAPVVVTTNVQFFESLFSNRRSRCRKLHNIAGSVIILDEAQALDADFLMPCLAVLEELVRHYDCTVVLCTATQPALGRYFSEDLRSKELMERPLALYEAFRKVHVALDGTLTLEELASHLMTQRQVLCVVNTRGNAAELYGLISDAGSAHHLSARMTAAHRTRKIDEIKSALASGRPCRVVSTQLIEAGVDLDFPVVYRAAAGIDSIVQAAGRCNREGRLPQAGQVHVFSLEGQKLMGWFSRTAGYGQEIMELFPDDPLSPEAVDRYFTNLYRLEEVRSGLDKHKVMNDLNEGDAVRDHFLFPFREVAIKFKLIEDYTFTVYAPHDEESQQIVEKLLAGSVSRTDMRKLGRYGVQVYENELRELISTGSVIGVGGSYLLKDPSLYDDKERGLLHVDESSYATDLLYH